MLLQMNRSLWGFLLATLIAVFCRSESAWASDASGDATQQVKVFHAALMDSTRLEADFAVRADALGATIDSVFDLERIARLSVGRHWRRLDDAGRAEYVGLVRSVVIGTWVSRFDADRGQQLVILETREVKPGRHIVRTQIVRPGGKKAVLDYYLRHGRVFNIVADGVSDLSLRRADYAATIKSSEFVGLLEHLHKQARKARETFRGAASDTPDS